MDYLDSGLGVVTGIFNTLMGLFFNRQSTSYVFKRALLHGISYLSPYKFHLGSYDLNFNKMLCTTYWLRSGNSSLIKSDRENLNRHLLSHFSFHCI